MRVIELVRTYVRKSMLMVKDVCVCVCVCGESHARLAVWLGYHGQRVMIKAEERSVYPIMKAGDASTLLALP